MGCLAGCSKHETYPPANACCFTTGETIHNSIVSCDEDFLSLSLGRIVEIALERKEEIYGQRQSQNLIFEVVNAYWQVIAAQNAMKESKSLLELSAKQQKALKQQVLDRNLSQIQGLKLESQLIDIQMRLNKFQGDYDESKRKLALVVGLSPSEYFELAPMEIVDVDCRVNDIEELENLALSNRPELYTTRMDEQIVGEVLSQVHLAFSKYQDALENYRLMKEQADVQNRLVFAARKSTEYGEYSYTDLIPIEMNAVISKIDALKANVALRSTVELLNNSVGIPLYFNTLETKDEKPVGT